MSNVFGVTNGRLFTPDLSLCGVRGVMRRVVMEQAALDGRDCVESPTDLEQLLGADEIFMTNSQFGIWPVRQLGEQSYRSWPVTSALMRALRAIGVKECAE
jgi:4-amino-4-deoxychorismate lyase